MNLRLFVLVLLDSLLDHLAVQVRSDFDNLAAFIEPHAPCVGVIEFEPYIALIEHRLQINGTLHGPRPNGTSPEER